MVSERIGQPIYGRVVVGPLGAIRSDLIHRPGEGTSLREGWCHDPPESRSIAPSFKSYSFVRVRRETGKKSVVRVHHGEGVAIHIDPESCADAREGIGEALTGERIGQAIEPRKKNSPGCRRRSNIGRQNGWVR